MSDTKKQRFELIALGVIAVLLLVVVPVLHANGVVSNFTIGRWGKYLCYAMLALSVNLLWGYTGLLSLCASQGGGDDGIHGLGRRRLDRRA